MRRCRNTFASLTILAVVPGFVAGCATVTREPANLDPHKRQIRAYVDSGAYQRDIASVAAQATEWLRTRAARRGGGRLAVVFDLDETLLLNWPYLSRQDFGYVPKAWEDWIEAGDAPPVEPVRDVYRTARQLGYDVIFLTGRVESQRGATERNLRAIGCSEYAALICRAPGSRGTNASFKAAERRRLLAEGWTIVANLGDQESDLAGGYAERTFKLPGPFYLTE